MNGTVEKRNMLWDLKSSSELPEPAPSIPSSERINRQKYQQTPWPEELGKVYSRIAGAAS